MTQPVEAVRPIPSVRERIIVALDVDNSDAAKSIVSQLKGRVWAFKVGLQLYMAAGPAFVRELVDGGERVFLDLKFHDIPNTVASASNEAARLGVWMFNIHAAGGMEMMRRSIEAVREVCDVEKLAKPLVIGVTVLTSSDRPVLMEAGINADPQDQVVRLARLAAEAGMDGVVCSANEIGAIRAAIGREHFLTVTPGIRPSGGTTDDQKRVTTLAQAIAAGSNYVVIGRPISKAADPVAAVEKLIEDAEQDINA